MPYEPITMKLDEDPKRLEIKTAGGGSFFLNCDPTNDTLGDLKMNIAKTLGLPVEDLHLFDATYDAFDEKKDSIPVHGDVLHASPNIDIIFPDKSKVKLHVIPKMTMNDLNDTIEERTGTPETEQRVFFVDSEGNKIDDTIRMTKAGIEPGSVSETSTSAPEDEKVTVRFPDGTSLYLDFDPECETKDDMMAKISCEFGVPIRDLPPILVNNEKLDDDYRPSRGDILDFQHIELEVELPDRTQIGPHFETLKFDHGQTNEMRSMTINVQHWNGKKFILDAQSDWYVDDVRDRIHEVEKVSPDEQNFLFNGKPVREELCLIRQGIVDDSTLYLEPMSIFISTPLKKKPIRLSVKRRESVCSIKRRVLNKLKKKKTCLHYCLVHGGEELEDDETLEDCDVYHDDLLTLEEFKLSVAHWSGDIFHLNGLKSDTTVKSMKKRIYKKKGIPMVNQKLSVDGRLLENTNTIKEEKIKHKTILVLERPGADIGIVKSEKRSVKMTKIKNTNWKKSDDEMMPVIPDWKSRIFFFDYEDSFETCIELIIMDWNGEQFTLDNFVLKNLVSDIKTSIFKMRGIKKKKQIIKFDGVVLDDKKTLFEQNVGHRSILVLELRGGNTVATRNAGRLEKIFTTGPTELVTNISITVNHWNGHSFSLSAAPYDYIDDVKDLINGLKNIPFEDLRLSFQGQRIHDYINLKEQGIVDGSILVLESMQIFVQLPMTEELLALDVETSQNILSVKKTVSEIYRLPFDSICIMYGKDELGNTKTLSDCGIEHEDEIRVEAFEIKTISWNGEMLSVDNLSPNCTTYDLKSMITQLHSIPIQRQQLKIKGQILNDNLKLKDQGVRHRTVLLLDHNESEQIVDNYSSKDSPSIKSNSIRTSTTTSLSTRNSPTNHATLQGKKLQKGKREQKEKKSSRDDTTLDGKKLPKGKGERRKRKHSKDRATLDGKKPPKGKRERKTRKLSKEHTNSEGKKLSKGKREGKKRKPSKGKRKGEKIKISKENTDLEAKKLQKGEKRKLNKGNKSKPEKSINGKKKKKKKRRQKA